MRTPADSAADPAADPAPDPAPDEHTYLTGGTFPLVSASLKVGVPTPNGPNRRESHL